MVHPVELLLLFIVVSIKVWNEHHGQPLPPREVNSNSKQRPEILLSTIAQRTLGSNSHVGRL